MHRKDKFSKLYDFLGHYEFGLNYKSLLDEIEEDKNNGFLFKEVNLVYSHLLNFKEKNIIFWL